MDIPYLIQLLTNKQSVLQNAKGQAYTVGDLNQLNAIDAELLGVQNTLAQLQMLASVTQVAATTNTSPADLLNSAIASSQTQGPSASALINGFDISAYATDAQYEQKVQNIINALPLVDTPLEIDVYIQSVTPGSPVTGEMVKAAATEYKVDVPLMLAIMQNDSRFGTLGVGATTNNPGNVGNTGTSSQSYSSWAEGVAAVAQWLSVHRVSPTVPTPTPTPASVPPPAPAASASTPTPPPAPPPPAPTPSTAATSTPAATTTPAFFDTQASTTPPVASSTPTVVTPATTTPPTITTVSTTPTTDATTDPASTTPSQ